MNLFRDYFAGVPAPSDIELEAADRRRRSANHSHVESPEPKLIPIHNYIKSNKQKWFAVVFFTTIPHDHPRTSKEGQIVAKFTGQGDAWVYAKSKQSVPAPLWSIVIR